MNLLNIFKNDVTKKDTRQWYRADMKTRDGSPYRTGVKANNLYEAAGIIALNMPKGNVIVNVEKGML
jgi:hypothetical protein